MSVEIGDTATGRYEPAQFSLAEFLDYEKTNEVFDYCLGAITNPVVWTHHGRHELFEGSLVTANTFQVLGVAPLLGRSLTPEDITPSALPVFALSYDTWMRSFGGDPNALGKTFILNNQPAVLAAVMPRRFAWRASDIWIPIPSKGGGFRPVTGQQFFFLIGHLRREFTKHNAEVLFQSVAERIAPLYPTDYPKQFHIHLEPLLNNWDVRGTLYMLVASVGLLLLISCVNVASLLLAKATARERELAVRIALGAPRWCVARQLFVESMLLALIGAVVGCAFAVLGLKGLIPLIPASRIPPESDIHLSTSVVLASLAITMLTALICGGAPVMITLRRDIQQSLRTASRSATGFRRARVRNSLIISQVALATVLLTTAGLLMHSFFLALHVNCGISRLDQVIITHVWAHQTQSPDQQWAFFKELLDKVQRRPGVIKAAAAIDFPPFGAIPTDVQLQARSERLARKGLLALCSSQYLQLLGAHLLRGRFLTDEDIDRHRRVAVVNQTLARTYFPDGEAIGSRVKPLDLQDGPVADPWLEIVGVIADVKNHGIREATAPQIYAPASFSSYGNFGFFVRTQDHPYAVERNVMDAILAADPDTSVRAMETMDSKIDLIEYSQPRFSSTVLAFFSMSALILVSIGVYGILSYSVLQRYREIGIRMSLGASSADIHRLIILSGLRLIFAGLAGGALIIALASRLLQSQFWGVKSYDPLTVTAVLCLLSLVGLFACYLPSRRAAKVPLGTSVNCE